MKKLEGTGVVIGRFQVPELHEGHRYIIDKANEHQRLMIIVGVHPKLVTTENPLDFSTREKMLRSAYPNATIAAVPDMPSDLRWSETVDFHIRVHCPIGPITLYGGRGSFIPQYHGLYPAKELDPISPTTGTDLRHQVALESLDSEDFRRGLIYASHNQYPRCIPCVDIAMVKRSHENKLFVLLGQKASNPGKWRFPGGFVDITDDGFMQAARRELHEETGMVSEAPLEYIGSYNLDDWRDSKSETIFTTFFLAHYHHGAARPSDDLNQVEWFSIEDTKSLNFADDHEMLALELRSHLEGEDVSS